MSKSFYDSNVHSYFYAQCRPTYPSEVMKKIIDYLSLQYTIQDDDVAIDIGCGTGQSSILLAPYFRRIIGYDISESQIEKANENNGYPNISYKVLKDTKIPHEDSSLSLIISAQAAHWFDLPRFYEEVKRTLKNNGVLALIGYAFVQVNGEESDKLNKIITNFYKNTLHGYVQIESEEVYFGRYHDERFHIPLSLTDFIRDDSLTIECKWSIRRLLGYIASWSGSQHFLKQHPESTIFDDLRLEILNCLKTTDDQYELNIMTDELNPNRCHYICPRKQRQCKMFPSSSVSTYCMEHLLYDPDLDEATKQKFRIPCPLNPQHSIAPHDLERHLRKCNQRPIILGPFHQPGCNSEHESETHDDDYPSILQEVTDEELQEFVIRMENIHDSLVQDPIGINETNFDCYLPHVNINELGYRSRKHLQQIGSIIANLVQLNLLQNNTCFLEMGAGRGQLSHELHACVKQEPDVDFVLVERDHQRYRFDAHHRREDQGPKFERYRLDIRDLYLPELPSVTGSQSRKHVVVISKHLCGNATDLALRCAVNGQRNAQCVRAIIIALCCHHRLVWNDYVGKEFFHRLNLTPKDFSLLRALTSWCTNENRHRMPEYGKRSTLDGISFQVNPTTPIDRSTYSKQRLFTIEEQEKIGLKAKRLLDWGRIEYLNGNGFSSHLKVYISKDITLENIALIATSTST